eukprot:RCo005451
MTIHTDHIFRFYTITQCGDFAVHTDATFTNHCLHLTTGTNTRSSQYFLQFFAHALPQSFKRCRISGTEAYYFRLIFREIDDGGRLFTLRSAINNQINDFFQLFTDHFRIRFCQRLTR